MKYRSSINVRKIIQTSSIFAVAAVLLSQSSVNAQSAAMANNELKSLVSTMQSEVDRRLVATDNATKAVEGSNTLAPSAKKTLLSALSSSKTSLTDLKSETSSTKDSAEAKALGAKINEQYSQYASANAAANTAKDTDAQQETVNQLGTLADDAQAKIDEAGANDQDVSSLQEQLKIIEQLIQSIAAIIASVIALILSLATGNFAEALVIFQTILEQLGINITAIDSAQGMLEGLITSFGQISFGASAGPGTDKAANANN